MIRILNRLVDVLKVSIFVISIQLYKSAVNCLVEAALSSSEDSTHFQLMFCYETEFINSK